MLPNFIIAGVARCGTTSLYYYLKQSPEIGFSSIKEPKYFSNLRTNFPHRGIGDLTVDDKIVKSFTEYKQLFEGLDKYKLVGEASSDYFFFHKSSINEIKKVLGDIPIIISLRNPTERAFSAYNNLIRDNREFLPFEEAINAEEKRINDNWDWMWAYKKGSLYSEALEAFYANFSKVKVIIFEELAENPKKIINEITDFLQISPIKNIDVSTKYSPSGKPKNLFIKLISSRNNYLYPIRNYAIKMIPRKYIEFVSQNFFQKNDMNEVTKKQLDNFFNEDVEKVEKLIGRNLNIWRK